MSKAATTTKLLAVIAFLCAMLAGCAETGSNPSAKEPRPGGAGAGTTEPPAGEAIMGGTAVGEEFADAALRPVGDSGVSGNVVLKEVGSLGVQVELTLSGLPNSGEIYFAQIHEGSCSEVPMGGDQDRREDHHGHEIEHGGPGPFLALVDPGSLAKVGEYADHPEHEEPPADKLPGNIDTPLSVGTSSDGTGAVTSLLQGVKPEQLLSGSPKYIDLRAPSHEAPEDWPALACADLSKEG